jgi:hypothetical protein
VNGSVISTTAAEGIRDGNEAVDLFLHAYEQVRKINNEKLMKELANIVSMDSSAILPIVTKTSPQGNLYKDIDISDATKLYEAKRKVLEILELLRPPTIETPSGEKNVIVGKWYNYSTVATDPNGENVKIVFDWGDGNRTETGFIVSGTPVTLSHRWLQEGTYNVRVQANNSLGIASPWSAPLVVNVETHKLPTIEPPSGEKNATVGKWYNYSTVATDPNQNDVKIVFDWGDGSRNETEFIVSGTPVTLSHRWLSQGVYNVRAQAINSLGMTSPWSIPLVVNVKLDTLTNRAPHPPEINGTDFCISGKLYEYTFTTIDPDDDNVKFIIEWGDGNEETSSFVQSGETVKFSHSWDVPGRYEIRAHAIDIHGYQSNYSVVEVKVDMKNNKTDVFENFTNPLVACITIAVICVSVVFLIMRRRRGKQCPKEK